MKSSIDKKKIKFEIEKLNINKDDIIVIKALNDYNISYDDYQNIVKMFKRFNIENNIMVLPKDKMLFKTVTLKKFEKWSKDIIKKYKENQCKVNK